MCLYKSYYAHHLGLTWGAYIIYDLTETTWTKSVEAYSRYMCVCVFESVLVEYVTFKIRLYSYCVLALS